MKKAAVSCALFAVFLFLSVHTQASASGLQVFKTKSYIVHTNAHRSIARGYGRYMDRMYSEYQKRFSNFEPVNNNALDLYLFQTHQDFQTFMADNGINIQNAGGVFFVQNNMSGLATWVQGKPHTQTVSVLQHEGFHQFAHARIGHHLPVWANEGIAQYFQDGIFVKKKMILGMRNSDRIELVKHAIQTDQLFAFEDMLTMTQKQWNATLSGHAQRGHIMYAQAWSMTYFLIRTTKKRQKRFIQFLQRVNQGDDGPLAFAQLFGRNIRPFYLAWRKHALALRPDPLTVAVSRLQFLGRGMLALRDAGRAVPTNMATLKQRLQRSQFRVTFFDGMLSRKMRASDDAVFTFTRNNGQPGQFELLAPSETDLFSDIVAPGLRPLPRLAWYRDLQGELTHTIVYK